MKIIKKPLKSVIKKKNYIAEPKLRLINEHHLDNMS